jgi:hypothetical protein
MLPLYLLFWRYKNSLQNYLTNLFLCPYLLTVFNQKHLSPVSSNQTPTIYRCFELEISFYIIENTIVLFAWMHLTNVNKIKILADQAHSFDCYAYFLEYLGKKFCFSISI